MKKRACLVLLVAVSLLLSGCFGKLTPSVQVGELEWEFSPYSATGYLHGVVTNPSIQNIRYLEIGVEVEQNGIIMATGWTNLTQVAAGTSRKFTITVLDIPPGEFDYEVQTSFKAGGVAW